MMDGIPKKQPIYTQETIYSQGQYFENNPTWHEEDGAWKADKILDIVKGNKLTPTSICEIGCGSGEILYCLYNDFNLSELVGYEISPQAFKICKPKEKERLKFHLGNLLKLETPLFDLLLCIDVFEHVDDYMGFLRNLKNRSRYFIFHIPLDMFVLSVLRSEPILQARSKVGHLHYFSKETALCTLADCGYRVIDHFYTAGALELKSKSLKTSLANLPRVVLYKINPDFSVRLLGGYSLMVLAERN